MIAKRYLMPIILKFLALITPSAKGKIVMITTTRRVMTNISLLLINNNAVDNIIVSREEAIISILNCFPKNRFVSTFFSFKMFILLYFIKFIIIKSIKNLAGTFNRLNRHPVIIIITFKNPGLDIN